MKALFFLKRVMSYLVDLLFRIISRLTWGKKLTIASGSYVTKCSIKLKGTNNKIGRNVTIWSEGDEGLLELLDSIQISKNCDIDCTGGIVLSSNVVISERVKILTHDHGFDPNSLPKASKLYVGKAAWIGADAIVLSSVDNIGQNAIIGSGAVLTKNVPDFEIWAGNPAKMIGRIACVE